MNQNFNPMECPKPDRIPSEQLPVRGDDFVKMMNEIYASIETQIAGRESLENKLQRIQLTGKIVWIVDRFVDIDFEGLKVAVPNLQDDNQLLVLSDETHAGQSSIYRIYNTASVPNVRYLGYYEDGKYPTAAAVEQFVNNAIAKQLVGLSDLQKKVDDLTAQLATANETINSLKDQVNKNAEDIVMQNGAITEMNSTLEGVCTVANTASANATAAFSNIGTLRQDVTAANTVMTGQIDNIVSEGTNMQASIQDLMARVTALEAK